VNQQFNVIDFGYFFYKFQLNPMQTQTKLCSASSTLITY